LIEGWNPSARRALNFSPGVSPMRFVSRAARVAESFELALFYRPDRSWAGGEVMSRDYW
jgi:hypothetical protein